MKQTAGVITALAVVLAIFGVANLPKSSTGGASSTQAESGTNASKGRPSTESSGPYGPCVRISEAAPAFRCRNPAGTMEASRFLSSELKGSQ